MQHPVESSGGKDIGFAASADVETASDAYAARFSGATGAYFLDVQTKIVLDLLRNSSRGTVLDVGGGHGQLAVPLVRQGFDVTVTGSDDSCRNRLDRLLPRDDFVYRTCDHLQMPFPDRKFDIVTAFRLLPHVQEWRRLLAEMCRISRHFVIFDYADRRSANLFYDALFSVKKKMEGNTRTFLLFSRREVAGELGRNGFTDIRFEPEFFIPMVLHRKANRPRMSAVCEKLTDAVGLKRSLGSPIIVRGCRPLPPRG